MTRPRTILVVEDNPVSRKMVRIALQAAGYTVLEAPDGATAIRILSESRPDLVLQDLVLPDCDGVDLVQRLRELPNGAEIPILAFTGFTPRAEQARSLMASFTDYLFKPVEPTRLLDIIETHLRPAPSPVGRPGEGRRVLIVDDDLLLRKLLAVHMEQAGFTVTLAADGLHALDLVRADPPEAVVSDVLMPGMDGFRLCRSIREDPEFARIPVILFSGPFADDEDRRIARDSGATTLVSRSQGCPAVVDAVLMGLNTADALPPPQGSGSFQFESYALRLIGQMERQVGRDINLAQRLATLEAELALLAESAHALESGVPLEEVIPGLLHRCLNAAGFSKGAVYLWDREKVEHLEVASQFGFPGIRSFNPTDGFGHLAILETLARGRDTVLIPADEVAVDASPEILDRAKSTFLLLSPLRRAGEEVGLLLMASQGPCPTEDWHPFARAVAAQLAQAVVHGREHARLVDSEERYRRLAENARKAEEALRVSMQSEANLQIQVRQIQKMDAIGQLAGGVAHDFNNLLTVILGHSDLLLRRVQKGDPTHRGTVEIRKAALQAAALTQQLLAFSRRQILQPKTLDLNAVVADVESMLRRLIGEDIDLVTLLSPRLGKVQADPGQIQQVILNLAVNARDAMPGGGRLTIETSDGQLDEEYARTHPGVSPGEFVMLAVSDTGTGMDEATRTRIFEPFFTTKEKGKGTGLGLATVYGVVKQTGGTIWVYSEPGKGSAFKIYLPRIHEASGDRVLEEANHRSPRGSETVLLVEDSEAVREFAREALQELGYRVIEARDGADALAQVKASPALIDLLLTDVVMPGMSGRELAEQLAPLRPAMKVLYTSGYTDRAIVNQGVLDRGMAFIQKPYTPDALGRKIREVLDAPGEKE